MGDFEKLIVACKVKCSIRKELESKIEELGLNASAYQSQEKIVSIEPNEWDYGQTKALDVILVGQRKWGEGLKEFCVWLRPYVLQGSGEKDVFAMIFDEYSGSPKLFFAFHKLE